jgi:hypothetical protein
MFDMLTDPTLCELTDPRLTQLALVFSVTRRQAVASNAKRLKNRKTRVSTKTQRAMPLAQPTLAVCFSLNEQSLTQNGS